jgi:hypothetical protein
VAPACSFVGILWGSWGIIGVSWIRFVLYGLGGWCGEVLFTAFTESVPQQPIHDFLLRLTPAIEVALRGG